MCLSSLSQFNLLVRSQTLIDQAAVLGQAEMEAPSGVDSVLDQLFVGPMWPASVLAGICLVFVLVSLLGVFDLDMDASPELDVDIDVDAGGLDAGMDTGAEHISGDLFGGLGAATLRAVNLDRVPLFIWLSIFSLFFWLVSYVLWFEFDVKKYAPTLVTSGVLVVRNAVIAVVVTKFLTGPLHNLLRPEKQYHAETLVGGIAVVETHEVDEKFGRAKYTTNGAPLLINIRTGGEIIPKGSQVHLLNYDSVEKVYLVELEKPVSKPDPAAPSLGENV